MHGRLLLTLGVCVMDKLSLFHKAKSLLILTSVIFSNAAFSQVQPSDDYKTASLINPNQLKPYEAEFERIGVKGRGPLDTFRDLDIVFKDIVVPGNGGLDIVIERSYNNAPDPRFAENATDTGYLPGAAKLMGDFWDINLPAIIFPTSNAAWLNLPPYTSKNGCQNIVQGTMGEKQPYISLYISENGIRASKSLHRAATTETQFSEISVDNWKAECITSAADGSSGRVVYSPDGKRYVFNYRPKGAGSWFLSKVSDRNGNWLQYNYSTYPTTWPLSPPLINSITSNDGRTVTFNYQTILGRPHLASIVAPGKRIDYTYEIYQSSYAWESDLNGLFWADSAYSNTQAQRTRLKSVVLADGTSWTFLYQPKSALKSITTPSGGIISYDFWPSAYGFNLQSRQTSGTLPASSWSFDDLNQSSQLGVHYVTGGAFCEKDTFTLGGASASPKYDSTLWNIGLPESITIYSNSACTTQIKKEVFQYDKRQIAPDPKGSDCFYAAQPFTEANIRCHYGDPATYAPIQTSHVITQDGKNYSTTTSSWDSYGNPLIVTESGTNGGNRTTTYSYYVNTSKWIFERATENFSGSNKSFSYDQNGNLTQIIKDGVTTGATYDGQGNVTSITHPRGLVHYFSNYKRGKPQSETQPEGVSLSRVINDAGQIVSETNADGKTTTYTYDGVGRVTSVVRPLGAVKNFSYTASTKTASRGGLIETTQYDGFNRPTSVTLGGIATTYKYNIFNQISFVSNPGSIFGTSYEYDVLGRLVKQTNSDGTYRSISYGGASKTIVDERGYPTTYAYRSYGDPNQQWVMQINTPESASISLLRNSKDLVTSVTQGAVTRTYGYNSNYYLTSINNPETGATTIGRDAAGNETSRKVGSSGTTLYTYDGQNRLVSIVYPGNTPTVTNTYSKTNKILTSNTVIANKSYIYDANGNLTNESITVDGLSFNTSYVYNSLDQLASIIYPRSGNVVNYNPDVLGRPTQAASYVTNVNYWPSGQIQQINYGNGVISRYEQNSRLWPSGFSTQKSGSYYINTSYGYDGLGNLTSISDSTDGSYNRGLGYDGLSRLTSASGPWGSGSIAYNAVGNITSQAFGAYGLTYTYDASNKLSNLSGSRNAAYSYDSYGNVASDASRAFTYDDVPNLRCANCADATNKILYGYDATNHRITIEKGGIKTYEIYDATGKQLIEFTPGQSNKLIEYIYLGGKRIAQRVSP